MPQMVQVVGGFSQNGHPARGWVSFTPSRLWVIENHVCWASLAPVIRLDSDGQFAVLLTPTDSDAIPWHYIVRAAAGQWMISPTGTRLKSLKELVDEHRAGPWSENRR